MNSIDGGNLAPEVEVDDSARATLPPGTVLGPLRILSLIASGGMGDVYRARDERLGRDVALKVLPSGITADRERIERFTQEAKAASALNHPNIVAIYEIGKDRPSSVVRPIDAKARRPREIHYIAMELVEGQTMRDFLADSPSLIKTLEVLAQTAEGLGKAHGAGIVHRDLKPDNIMVSHEGYAKVVDFGLAKLVEPPRGWNPLGADSPTMRAITAQGEVIGTAGYMSPEQIIGKAVDQRSDIFSFGCIVYEAVTKRRPFEGESFVDTMHQVLHATPPPIDHHELQRIVSKCLVKDRENRYQSIRDVALDLRAVARELEHGAPASAGVAGSSTPAKAGAPSRWIAAAIVVAIIAAFAAWRFAPRATNSTTSPTQRATMQRITSSGHVVHIAASSDGRFVAYTTYDDKGQGISLAQTATNSSVNIVPAATKPYYVGLAFTADSNYLLTTSYDNSVVGTLNRIPLFGGAPTKLVEDADTGANASADGTSIVFTRDVLEHGESRVIVAKQDGTNERIVAAFPLPRRAVSPVWSPDGKRIAVAHGTSLYTIDPAKATKSRVATSNWRGSIRDLSWSGNDTLLVSGADDRTAGHLQLFSIALNDGSVRNVTNDSDDYFEPRLAGSSIAAIQAKRQATLWSTDAHSSPLELTRGLASSDGLGGAAWTPDRHIVYTSASAGPVDLWIANEDGSSPRQLTHDDALESDPAVTADGASIVYLTRSRTQSALWRINVDGSQPHQLATSPTIFAFATTPDSKRAVYASCDDKSGCALMSVALDGGAQTMITPTGVFLNYVRVTPDGARVVFAALADRKVKLFSVPITGGKPALLLDERATNPAISPDGKQIACVHDMGEKGANLAIFNIDGGAPPQILKLEGMLYRWMPDGSIVYIKSTGSAENLFTYKDGATKPITQFADGSIVNMNVSPSGRILFTHVVETRDAVLLNP
jgi:serine/threonine protein kinase